MNSGFWGGLGGFGGGVPLHVVKMANATWGHYGEMAGGQPWVLTTDGVVSPDCSRDQC